MVFNNFGAPLYESFEGHSTTSVVEDVEPEITLNQMQVALDEIEYDFDCSDKIEQNNKVYCRRHQGQEIEAFQGSEEGGEEGGEEVGADPEDEEGGDPDPDPEDEEGGDPDPDPDTDPDPDPEDEEVDCPEGYNCTPKSTKQATSTTQATLDDEEAVEEAVEEDEDNWDEEPSPTTTEGFLGSNTIENFSGREMREKATSLTVVLRSVLFACLFYILAHPDTRSYLLKNLKFLKQFDFLTVSMVLFLVLHYVLSIFV
tara:strand:+ start:1732 stop:2502 length:771 start_codon:yes stop_codon:yes gene_type:complete